MTDFNVDTGFRIAGNATAVQGIPINSGTPTDGQVLSFDPDSNRWEFKRRSVVTITAAASGAVAVNSAFSFGAAEGQTPGVDPRAIGWVAPKNGILTHLSLSAHSDTTLDVGEFTCAVTINGITFVPEIVKPAGSLSTSLEITPPFAIAQNDRVSFVSRTVLTDVTNSYIISAIIELDG